MKKPTLIKITYKYENIKNNFYIRFMINNLLFKIRPLRKINESKIRIGNNILYLDSNDSLGLSMNTNFEPIEMGWVKNNLKKGDVVLDIGANIGIYTLIMAEIVGDKGKVYAFEPDPTNFNILKKNIEFNGYKNVVLINNAVSNKNEKIKLFLSKENTANHKIYNSHENRNFIEIQSIRLDDYFKDYNGKINFIKIDVEGSEPGVLNGASKILTKNSNLKIITEFCPMFIEQFGYSNEQYLKDIANFGFSIYEVGKLKNESKAISIDEISKKVNLSLKNFTSLFCVKSNI